MPSAHHRRCARTPCRAAGDSSENSAIRRVLWVWLIFTAGCTGGDGTDASRRVTQLAWDTAFVIGGRVNDTTLIRPWLLTAAATGIFVYDYGSASVKAFDLAGRARWTHGRRGLGPGEFRNPVDIRLDSDRHLWILDVGAARIAVLDSSGVQQQLLQLQESPQQLVLLDTLRIAVLYSADNRLAARLHPDGTFTDLLDYPPDSVAPGSMNLRLVRAGSNGRQWALAFVFTGSLVVFDGAQIRCSTMLREADLLRARVQTPGEEVEIAAGLAVTEDAIWVLGIALDDRAARYGDEYDLFNCDYKRSVRFPVRARTVALVDDMFVVSYEEPAPAIAGLRAKER